MSVNWDQITEFQQPEHSPGLLLWQLSNSWQREIRKALQPHQITHVQFVLLACVGWLETHSDSPITQKALADQAGTDPMMTSQVIRSLEEKGFVARKPHPTDSRAIVLALTNAGKMKVEQALPDVEATDRAFFSANRPAFLKMAGAEGFEPT